MPNCLVFVYFVFSTFLVEKNIDHYLLKISFLYCPSWIPFFPGADNDDDNNSDNNIITMMTNHNKQNNNNETLSSS